jgi:hypothetical protein
MRNVSKLRPHILRLLAEYDKEARAEVMLFLQKYPSDTPYDIYVVTRAGERIPYMVNELPYDSSPEHVAGFFVLANPFFYSDSDAPQFECVELEFNYGEYMVFFDILAFRLYYKVRDKIYGYEH